MKPGQWPRRKHTQADTDKIKAEVRILELETAIIETLEENKHLADGDDCTLIRIKRVMGG